MYIKKLYATAFRLIIIAICIAVELFTNACSRYGFVYNMDPNDKSIDQTGEGNKPGNNPCLFRKNSYLFKVEENGMTIFYSIMRKAAQYNDDVELIKAYSLYSICCSADTTRGKCPDCKMTGYKYEDDKCFLNVMRAIMQAAKTDNLNRFSQEEQRALVSRLDYFGHSFLFYAAYNNDYKTAAYLMQLGACPYYYRDKGMSPIEAAYKHHNKKMDDLLSDPQYPAHKELCDICKHTVLHKKYSMETESYTDHLGSIDNSECSRLSQKVQLIEECVASSSSYPIGKYVFSSSAQYNNDNNKQKSSFKLPMAKRQKACSAGALASSEEQCPPPKVMFSINSSEDSIIHIGGVVSKIEDA